MQRAGVVVVASAARRELFNRLPAAFDSSNVQPIILVTDSVESFQNLYGFRFDGAVQAPREKLLTVGMQVFQMMAGLMAPETFLCTDVEDFTKVMASGQVAEICYAAWSRGTGLVFASLADEHILTHATSVLVHLDVDCGDCLQQANRIFTDVASRVAVGVPVVRIGTERMLVRASDETGFLDVPLLCVRFNGVELR